MSTDVRIIVCVLKFALVLMCLSDVLSGQTCRVWMSGDNTWRKVMGPVDKECGAGLHSPPFGNWGVTSNFGHKEDGNQFQGWYWTDSKYQWNSCTFHEWAPPNCSYYNWSSCAQQVQQLYGAGGMTINVHGTTLADIMVNCPEDTDSDGVCDQGGCKEIYSIYNGTNWMSLYELDEPDGDDLVQSLYFPNTVVNLTCQPGSCDPAESSWVGVSWYQDPSSEQRVEAQIRMRVPYAYYQDSMTCEYLRFSNPRYDCTW